MVLKYLRRSLRPFNCSVVVVIADGPGVVLAISVSRHPSLVVIVASTGLSRNGGSIIKVEANFVFFLPAEVV